ncbi:uncharacterized protein LOC132284179 [Cornus florida]|uniref:uncharacterized protein LOC132284179 n=1 Tax=Cornus florida TaxID=4283 RepID=UPI0028A0979E|nr:uncharacterized protein LOC132284179 [Cornus florida]
MCDCVPSTLLPYSSGIRIRNLGFTRCNRKTSTVQTREIVTPFCPHLPNLHFSDSTFRNGCGSFRSNGAKMNSFAQNSSELGSGEFEFYNELGFKETGNEPIEFETDPNGKETKNSNWENGIDISNGPKVEGRSDDSLASSGLDFPELKNGVKSKRSLKDEDLVKIEGSDGVNSKLEESERRNEDWVSRSGRQLMRRSNMIAKQVISVQSALCLGFVSQLWVDTNSWVVLVVEVRPHLLSGELEKFLLDDVSQVGDVVLIQDECVMENEFKMVGLETLVGYNVVTPNRQNIGKVRGYTFNINSGGVESLELDSFGISIIPSSLVSTYALFVEDILEVVSDTVVVHEAAASRIQRLTKGFWDAQNVRNSKDKFGEYYDFERQSAPSDHGRSRRRSFTRQKFRPKRRETEDDWELPMDYL